MSKKQRFQETLKAVESIMASISDLETKKVLNKLLNLVETIHSENEELKEENQQLKDEVSHLKGEQGKPLYTDPLQSILFCLFYNATQRPAHCFGCFKKTFRLKNALNLCL